LINNTGVSTYGQGINLDRTENNTLIGNNGTCYTYEDGICLQMSTNNILISNWGSSNSLAGIELANYSSNNVMIENNGTSVSGFGILVYYYSTNNSLTNNSGFSDSGYGIQLRNNINTNILTNNTALTNSGKAFDMSSVVYNNTIYSLDARAVGSGGVGIYIHGEAANNTFYNSRNISGFSQDIFISSLSGSVNNSFVNCTYNASKERIDSVDGEIIRKWYYKILVNSSTGKNLSGVIVSGVNSSGVSQFSLTTGSLGSTNQVEVIDYLNVNGTRIYYSNYTITASLSGYGSSSKQMNFTSLQNKLDDYFTLILSPITVSSTDSASGSGTWTFRPSEENLEKGYSVNIAKNQKVEIPVGENKKQVKIESVGEEKVIVSVDGENYEIENSASEKVDLDSDGFYDIKIVNNGVTGNYANLEFKLINEKIESKNEEEQNENIFDEIPDVIKSIDWKIYVLSGAILILIVFWVLLKKEKHKKRYKKYGY